MGEHPQFPGGELSLLAVPYLNAHLPDEDLKGRGGRGVVGSEAGSGPEGDDGLAQDAVVGDAFRAAAFLRGSRLRQVDLDRPADVESSRPPGVRSSLTAGASAGIEAFVMEPWLP